MWGCYLSGMWIYRLGLTKAKEHALTGKPLLGPRGGRHRADQRGRAVRRARGGRWPSRPSSWPRSPSSQLAAMKLIVNQAYENMGLRVDPDPRPDPRRPDAQHAGRPGLHRDGEHARASAPRPNERDAPFGDYSAAGAGPPARPRPRDRALEQRVDLGGGRQRRLRARPRRPPARRPRTPAPAPRPAPGPRAATPRARRRTRRRPPCRRPPSPTAGGRARPPARARAAPRPRRPG